MLAGLRSGLDGSLRREAPKEKHMSVAKVIEISSKSNKIAGRPYQ